MAYATYLSRDFATPQTHRKDNAARAMRVQGDKMKRIDRKGIKKKVGQTQGQ